ncbi:DUF397 domain-containing protein [Streptomyces bluensis]|uniref:DUF397 domain-containing protein n=1 Tax=Streptomyces bluensis TaxID=33897 RepID=UPI003328D67A
MDTGSSLNARTARRLSTASYTSTPSRPLLHLTTTTLYRLQPAQEEPEIPLAPPPTGRARDSKTPRGPKLAFRAEAWPAFVDDVKAQ